MITVGVDLAAQPLHTALSAIEWADGHAVVRSLTLGATDPMIVAVALDADKIGIDCALGWPDDFVDFVVAHSAGRPLDRRLGEGMDWRRLLAYRATDRAVREQTGRWPLSVSTDRLGLTAMRCAALLDELGGAGITVDRTGAGAVAEVYPAASLRYWGFATSGYKTDIAKRSQLVDALRSSAPWLDFDEHEGVMRRSDDAFDSVIAALAARASALGHSTVPPPEQAEQAGREGWIAMPTVGLADLANA